MRPGKLPDTPAAVLILRDGPVRLAKLAHRFCARSGLIDVPGLTAVMYDPARAVSVDGVAAFLPYQAGHRPALLLEVRATVSTDVGQGERVDRVAGWLLEHGLHLVAAADGEVEAAPGWAVHLRGGSGLRVSGPIGELYDGDLQADLAWQDAVTTQGSCLLLVGTGLGLDQAPHGLQEALDRVDAVARQGRLTGALVTVEIR
ncbi:hypothetical protein [Nonomuraea turcica]|uniref:hypothetical protein n=1 Tax=Nonomuraea sp. G32 TaxID=3067274 RepID=UPI00273B3141|nr:hypothetical protein [Nonomuraea sp. G32]MDP4511807.1 hypothetical protein [Nonomuraea sp. G32]